MPHPATTSATASATASAAPSQLLPCIKKVAPLGSGAWWCTRRAILSYASVTQLNCFVTPYVACLKVEHFSP